MIITGDFNTTPYWARFIPCVGRANIICTYKTKLIYSPNKYYK
eukprot:UN14944